MTTRHIPLTTFVSRLFEPVLEIPLAISLAVWFAMANGFRWRFLLLLLLIDAFLPFVFFLHLLRKGEVSNWDTTNRKERIPLYLFTLIAHGVGLALAFLLGKTELALILLSFYVVALVFFLITLFWKISIHVGVNALLVTLLNVIFGWQYWWLYVIVGVVTWARVQGKYHTLPQALAGGIIGGVGFLLILNLFGLTL